MAEDLVEASESCAARRALAELLQLSGIAPGNAEQIAFDGRDPLLPLPYRFGAAAGGALAAVGLAAARLCRMRGSGDQRITVDLAGAVISLAGSKFLAVNGVKPAAEWAPLMGFYPVQGGRHIFIHANFPHLRDRALAVLGCAADRDAIAAACRGWDGEVLETAIHAGGGCAGFVRTEAEWEAHPHQNAIAGLPPLEIIRLGDAPPEPMRGGSRPLSGIRVLDLTRVIAGPTATRTLAEHGADVLKVTSSRLASSGALDIDTGLGKLSANLDLDAPAEAARLGQLAHDADIFVQSYRPESLASRGFGPADLARRRPGLIYVTLSAWGHDGPWRLRRGYDTVVQSVTGFVDRASPEGTPAVLPVSAIDYVSGYLMACGAMAALARRAREGGSWLVRVSLATTGQWIRRRGLLPDAVFHAAPSVLEPDRAQPFMADIASPLGDIRYFGSPLRMSETPPRLVRPPVRLGHHAAAWPDR